MDRRAVLLLILTLLIDRSHSFNFCSGISTYGTFGIKDLELKINGSPESVANYVSSGFRGTCTCSIIPITTSVPRFHVYLTSDLTTCDRGLNVSVGSVDSGEVKQTFRCDSGDTEAFGIDSGEEVHLVLIMYGNQRPAGYQYDVRIETEPESKLELKCSEPEGSTTTTEIISADFIENTATTSTEKSTAVLAKTKSNDTMIIVGVVVGLGLFFLFFISFMLCYIARRRRGRQSVEKATVPQPPGVYQQNRLRRTLTHFYAKLRINRPLPKIPGTSILTKKPLETVSSGHYASIRSSATRSMKQTANKQNSIQSDETYMEPVTIYSVSEITTESVKNTAKDIPDVTKQDSVDYLHPTEVTDSQETVPNKDIFNRSSHPKITKETSVESTDSYVKPSKVACIQGTYADKQRNSSMPRRSGVTKEVSVESTVSYIKPFGLTDTTDSTEGKQNSRKPITKEVSMELTGSYTVPLDLAAVIDKFEGKRNLNKSGLKGVPLESTDSYMHTAALTGEKETVKGESQPAKSDNTGLDKGTYVESADSYIYPVGYTSNKEANEQESNYVNLANENSFTALVRKIEGNEQHENVHKTLAENIATNGYVHNGTLRELTRPNVLEVSGNSVQCTMVYREDDSRSISVDSSFHKANHRLSKPKSPVMETDSNGYMKMDMNKHTLHKQESPFPELFSYTTVKDDLIPVKANNIEEKRISQSNVKKPRRYVRSSETNHE